ncbi:protein ABHD15-like [Pecten maximus]|uniref:protein ABHD15-like n=1 Tax=Pecten maximus TaxID=6579 RepID=UPI001457FA8A|nr:protein ABHD15-like [Pecten maximus]
MLTVYYIFFLPFYLAVIGTIILSAFVFLKSLLGPKEILPKLYYKDSTLATHILRKCSLATRMFSVELLLRNRHLQTLLPWILPHASVQFDREYLLLKDKGVVALDWVSNIHVQKRKRKTVMVVIPGITGCAVSVSKICQAAAKRGFQTVVFNRRGHGGTVLTTPKFQSYGDPSDLRQVVKYIHGRFPKALITMVSYGTGCEVLLSYLGEFGSSAHICGGVCVSPSFDISERSKQKISGIYDLFLLLYLKKILWQHAKALLKVVDVQKALKTWSLTEYDQCVSCKMHGYNSIEEFWERNNPLRDVDDISIPLMFVSSLDDPVYKNNNIPYDLFKFYPNFLMVATERGGHCGFLENLRSLSWADSLTLDYLDAILEFTTKGFTIDYHKSPARSTI